MQWRPRHASQSLISSWVSGALSGCGARDAGSDPPSSDLAHPTVAKVACRAETVLELVSKKATLTRTATA
jgi:hypothetical protein